MKYLSPRLFLAVIFLACTQYLSAQTLLAGWDFQTTSGGGTAAAAAPSAPTTYVANFGSGTIYMNGTNGSSTWITTTSGNEVTSFAGTATNAGTGFATSTSSPACLAIVGGTGGTAANGKYIIFKFSMTGYQNLVVSYATQGTSTGFNTQTWEYSTDGTTWTTAQAIGSIPTSFGLKTLSTITGLDNATNAYLRLTPTGASSASGNNRIDNIQFNATALPSTYLSATALHGFGTSNCINTTFGPDSFTITGVGLTTANVTVGALTGFSYATSYAGPYSSSLTLSQGGGAYSQKVYVEFTPTLVQSYNGNIVVGGGGATSINVAATGSAINTAPTVNTGGASTITTSSAIDTGFVTGAGCSPFTSYGIEYSTTSGFTTGTGTQVTSSNMSGGTFTSSLTGLSSGTTYYYHAYVTTAYGTYYGPEKSFLTTSPSPILTSSALSSFGNVCTGSTGGPNSFTITGVSLTTAAITVGPLTGYTFSTTAGGTYTSSLTITQGGGVFSQAIYVKFSPTLVQSYAGTIPVSGGGSLLSADVSADGTGVAPPAQPSAITGPAAPCKSTAGITYSVTNASGVTYTWTLPSGWVQTAGSNSNSITVTTGTTGGTVSVVANNGTCDGPASTLTVAPVTVPSQPSAISGSPSVCTGATGISYSVTNVSGITYIWNLPFGWSQTGGGSTNSITVSAGSAGGTISVTPTNGNCSGTPRTLSVSVDPLPTVSGSSNSPICQGDTLTLTATGSNFMTYQWSNGSATSGQIYQQNFNSLPSSGTSVTWTDNSTIPGWYASSSNLATNGLVLGTGSSNSGNLFNFGSTSSTDRALGSLASSGTGTLNYGLHLTNTTGAPIDRIFIQYTGEQWRDGGSGAVANSLTFSYSTSAVAIGSGSYTNVPTLDYTSTVASGTGAGAALNGNANQSLVTGTVSLGTPLASGSSVWLRWTDLNDAGSDMGIALDDVTVVLYSSSSTLLATPSGRISVPTFAASGELSSAVYSVPNASASGTYTLVAANPSGCTSTATTVVTVNQHATATANSTPTATINNTATYTLSGSATNYSSYTWSSNGAGSLTGTATLTPTYHPATNETGNVTITLTVNPLSPCAGTAVDSMVLTLTPAGNVWIGNTSDWFTASNWTSGTVPNSCSTPAIVQTVSGGHVYPVLTASAQVSNLTISSGAQITVNSGQSLSLCGNWTGGATTAATISGGGRVVLNGTTAQTFTGNTSLNTLTVNKTAGTTTISGTVNVNTALVLTRGNVTAGSGSVVTLKSTGSGTAYLDNFTSGTAGTWTGNLTVERYVSNATVGYRDISSPVSNAKVSDWAADFTVTGANGVNCWYAYSPYPTLQYYSESTNTPTTDYYGGFISSTAGTNPLTPMRGYAARLYTAPLTITTTGTPGNGTVSTTITKTNTSNPSADGWNLIGNPYPSPISWNAVKALNAGKTDGSAYLFQATGEYTGNWATWNGTVGTNGATDQISSTQAFMVLASATNTISVNNTVRVAATASPFFKTAGGPQADEIRLTLTGAGNSDEIVSYSDANATAGYDAGYDAAKIAAGSSVYLSFDMPAKEIAINVMDQLTEVTVLPLKIAATDAGDYTLTATELNTDGLTAYLKDNQSGTLADLSTTAPVLHLAASQYYTGRYSVVFKKSASTTATGVQNVIPENQAHIYAYQNKIYIVRTSSNAADIEVTNLLGQTVAQLKSTSEKTEFEMPANEPWYAIVKLNENGKVTVQKVIISAKQ
ncbi:MAG: hypothetical protein JST90_14315 [Bacteroidetes bacterium]|nr:hypothetical protein [Bacteroidota bacterium]